VLALFIVFIVLSILSLSIRLLTSIFPVKSEDDAAVVAALNSHLGRVYPQSKITKIEEEK
jgi:hypothetical protein